MRPETCERREKKPQTSSVWCSSSSYLLFILSESRPTNWPNKSKRQKRFYTIHHFMITYITQKLKKDLFLTFVGFSSTFFPCFVGIHTIDIQSAINISPSWYMIRPKESSKMDRSNWDNFFGGDFFHPWTVFCKALTVSLYVINTLCLSLHMSKKKKLKQRGERILFPLSSYKLSYFSG